MVTYSLLLPLSQARYSSLTVLEELAPVVGQLPGGCEILAIEHGLTPVEAQTWLAQASAICPTRLLSFVPPTGLSAALSAGFAEAHGETVVVFDPSGAYVAADIPRLLARLSRLDAVFGFRRISGMRGFLRSALLSPRWAVLGKDARDPGCLFFAARREAVTGLNLCGGMHRYLAWLIACRGYRVGENSVGQTGVTVPAEIVWPNPLAPFAARWLGKHTYRGEVIERTDAAEQPEIAWPASVAAAPNAQRRAA